MQTTYKERNWLGRTSPKWLILYRVERKTLTQSINKEMKERKSIYIAAFILRIVSKRSGMNHTVLPENYTMPAFPS